MPEPACINKGIVGLFCSPCSPRPNPTLSSTTADDNEEDLSFLEEAEANVFSESKYPHSDAEYSDNEDEDFENYDDFEVPLSFSHEEEAERTRLPKLMRRTSSKTKSIDIKRLLECF
ncbi:Protein disulfide-isomerase [Forsythia ovata]|uniref:Protein disulfide-isomerase n=1 Tax=Forsythia ovata TaxID=205694 RepID=A0ABD1U6X7_9LAMI